jgi:ferrous iron transport protein B
VSALVIDYGETLERHIAAVSAAIAATPAIATRYPIRWLAVALIDGDEGLDREMAAAAGGQEIMAATQAARVELEAELGGAAVTAVAAARYEWINRLVGDVVDRSTAPGASPSDRIDAVVTHRWLGIPIFLFAMWGVFKLTTDVAGVFLDFIDGAVGGPIARMLSRLLAALGLGGSWVESLVVDGVLAGVGAVLTFLPVLLLLYVALGLLEDTGYMARAAFLMDRVMGGVGLPGKSFLPMLVGFGCTVPAITATRTLESRRDRILTGLLVPFMSCGARLPVYILIATAFFPAAAGTAVFAMYLLGIVVALLVGLVLRSTVLRSAASPPAIMELPPYRRPMVSSIWHHTWERTRAFLADAASIILVTSIVVWLLMSIDVGGTGSFADTDVEDSAFALAAGVAAPALEPMGLGTWEVSGSLLSGFVAKEVIIGTMAQVYGVEQPPPAEATFGDDLEELVTGFGEATRDTVLAIPGIVGIDLLPTADDDQPPGLVDRLEAEFEASSGGHGALAGAAFMVFVLLYTPCMAAIAAERRELGTRWMWTSIIGQTALAWVVAVAVFQVGKLAGF